MIDMVDMVDEVVLVDYVDKVDLVDNVDMWTCWIYSLLTGWYDGPNRAQFTLDLSYWHQLDLKISDNHRLATITLMVSNLISPDWHQIALVSRTYGP